MIPEPVFKSSANIDRLMKEAAAEALKQEVKIVNEESSLEEAVKMYHRQQEFESVYKWMAAIKQRRFPQKIVTMGNNGPMTGKKDLSN